MWARHEIVMAPAHATALVQDNISIRRTRAVGFDNVNHLEDENNAYDIGMIYSFVL